MRPASGRSSGMSSASDTNPCRASADTSSPRRSFERFERLGNGGELVVQIHLFAVAVHAKRLLLHLVPVEGDGSLANAASLASGDDVNKVVCPRRTRPWRKHTTWRAADVTACSSCLVPPPASFAMFTVYSRFFPAIDVSTNFTVCCSRSTPSTDRPRSSLDPLAPLADGIVTAVSLARASISSSVPEREDRCSSRCEPLQRRRPSSTAREPEAEQRAAPVVRLVGVDLNLVHDGETHGGAVVRQPHSCWWTAT